jgi:hypothetical protein
MGLFILFIYSAKEISKFFKLILKLKKNYNITSNKKSNLTTKNFLIRNFQIFHNFAECKKREKNTGDHKFVFSCFFERE